MVYVSNRLCTRENIFKVFVVFPTGARSTSCLCDKPKPAKETQIWLKGGRLNRNHGAHIKHNALVLLPYASSPPSPLLRTEREMSESYTLLEIGSQPYFTTFQDLDGRLAFSM